MIDEGTAMSEKVTQPLTFAQLRAANEAREADHDNHFDVWSIEQWVVAVNGEWGELCEELVAGVIDPIKVGNELCDVICYLDLLARATDIDLGGAVRLAAGRDNKYNPDFTFLRTTLDRERGLPSMHWCEYVTGVGMWWGQYNWHLKRIHRRQATLGNSRRSMALALGEMVCELDRLAYHFDIDLGEAVRTKFNAVSDRIGSSAKL